MSPAQVCEVGLGAEQCGRGEVCQPLHDKSRNGLCQCDQGTVRQEGACVSTSSPLPVSTPSFLPVNISVLVENKTLTLPQTSVSLTVLTSPEPSEANPYK